MPGPREHVIVCGDSSLAYRITSELATRYGEQVTVILPSRESEFGPQIAALPRVRVLERRELDSDAFIDAGVASARALALVWQDDLGNFHAALRATELNPALRLVLAVFNSYLGDRIRQFFTDCAVFSGTAMSAPYFVAAALGEPAPGHVRVHGRTLYVARRADVRPTHALCTLATLTENPSGPVLLPASGDPSPDQLVLAVADGTPRNPLTRRRGPARLLRLLRGAAMNKFSLTFMFLLAVMLVGFVLLAAGAHYSFSNTVYLGLMDLTGSALTQASLGGSVKFSQVLLTVDGMAFIPVVTALVVGARLRSTTLESVSPRGDHVIVVGLGNVGTRVVGQLHDLGFDVACVDSDPNARGIPMARKLGLPIIIGKGYLEETLRAAGVETCSALVSVTSTDTVNLETALHARALREEIRIVLRLNDDDLAQRLQKTIGNTVSRSVAYLAAPAFAAAMLDHQVLRTVAVGRHVLLVAELLIEPGSELAGAPVRSAEREGQVRVLAVQPSSPSMYGGSAASASGSGTPGTDWAPDHERPLQPGDRVLVIATRAGLRVLLAESAALTSAALTPGGSPRGLPAGSPRAGFIGI
jgi:Trk K+ transport system NAD-binding subunit